MTRHIVTRNAYILTPMRQKRNSQMATRQLLERFNEAQRQLVVQTADLPLGTLAEMVGTGAIDLSPSFQRRERWDTTKQSALIESFLLNVPVPPVYLSEQEDGTYTAIDGKQRLKAIHEFISNGLKLHGLDKLELAEGATFADLPPEIANALKLRPYIRVVTLLKQTHPGLKYEVFLRLNKGGEILNAQEIRNVAYRGSLNNLIYKLSENAFLRRQLKIIDETSGSYKDMSDAEYVLRFFTLQDRWKSFSGKLAHEMNDFMEKHQRARRVKIEDLTNAFETATSRCEALWGDNAFKRSEKGVWRDQFLAGMYDAQMLSVIELDDAETQDLRRKRARIEAGTHRLFDNDEFEKAVRTGTNTPARIRFRVTQVLKMLRDI